MENAKRHKNVSVGTRNLVTSALLASIICLVTGYVLHIPTPDGGYAHIGDSIIYLSATILPLPYAIACSTIGAGLADLTTGSFIWVLPTLVIKSILVLCFSNKSEKIITARNVIGAILAGILGCILYMIVQGLYYGNIKTAFVFTALGLIQPVGSFIVFIVLGLVLDKIDFKKYFN